MSIGSRKYSGSSSFLNKFQRGSVADAPPREMTSAQPEVSPEKILATLSDVTPTPVPMLEQRFGVAPGGLNEAIGELASLELVRVTPAPAAALLLTDLGLKAAGFAKIARQ